MPNNVKPNFTTSYYCMVINSPCDNPPPPTSFLLNRVLSKMPPIFKRKNLKNKIDILEKYISYQITVKHELLRVQPLENQPLEMTDWVNLSML